MQQDRARVIGPAMSERLRAALKHTDRDARVARYDAEDSAHSEFHLQKFTRRNVPHGAAAIEHLSQP